MLLEDFVRDRIAEVFAFEVAMRLYGLAEMSEDEYWDQYEAWMASEA